MSPEQKNLIAKFKRAVTENILLTLKNKEYLLSNAESFPQKMIETVLTEIEAQNEMVARHSKLAIAKNPKLVEQIKQKAKNIRKELHEMMEDEEQEEVETKLEEKLSKL